MQKKMIHDIRLQGESNGARHWGLADGIKLGLLKKQIFIRSGIPGSRKHLCQVFTCDNGRIRRMGCACKCEGCRSMVQRPDISH